MATFKTVVIKQRADGFWPVYIRVTHNRKSKYLNTGKVIETKSVDKKAMRSRILSSLNHAL